MINTTEQVTEMVNDPNNIKLMQTLFEAIAYTETIRDIIEPKQQQIVDFYKFKVGKQWVDTCDFDIITNHKHMYLADDEDFNIYLKEMSNFYKQKGLKIQREGNCPLLEAESLVRDIKKQIADTFEPYFGFGYDRIAMNLERYRKYFDLLMTMFASKINNNFK